MLEMLIEAAIVRAFDGLAIPGLCVDGFWQPAPDGEAKPVEGAGFSAALGVTVSPRRYESFSSKRSQFIASLALRVRQEMCPSARDLAEVYALPVLRLLQRWQFDIFAVKSAFSVSSPESHGFPGETFTPHGFMIDGGDVASDKESKLWTVDHSLTIRGVIAPIPPSAPESTGTTETTETT